MTPKVNRLYRYYSVLPIYSICYSSINRGPMSHWVYSNLYGNQVLCCAQYNHYHIPVISTCRCPEIKWKGRRWPSKEVSGGKSSWSCTFLGQNWMALSFRCQLTFAVPVVCCNEWHVAPWGLRQSHTRGRHCRLQVSWQIGGRRCLRRGFAVQLQEFSFNIRENQGSNEYLGRIVGQRRLRRTSVIWSHC